MRGRYPSGSAADGAAGRGQIGHSGGMAVLIRPLTAADAGPVLRINEEVVHKLAPMDQDEYRWFLEVAACAWGAEVDGELAGFVLVLDPGVAYESRNYRWFSARFDRFAYLDRVAVGPDHRRKGVGAAIYDAVEARAAGEGRPVLLEVNVQPPNHASLAFHERRGYRELGELAHDDGAKVVRLLRWDPPASGRTDRQRS
jgi:predicted GNAT superfamily acetyltransferase